MPVIKCDISENNKVIEVVTKETNTAPADLIITLEDFRQNLNKTLTKMIENDEDGISNDIDDDFNEEPSSGDESVEELVSPKKRKVCDKQK